jgi:hypothetical protein
MGCSPSPVLLVPSLLPVRPPLSKIPFAMAAINFAAKVRSP